MLANTMLASKACTAPRTLSAPRRLPANTHKPSRVCLTRVQSPEAPQAAPVAPLPPITLTEGALKHLQKLKSETQSANTGSLLLRVGVKQGGCSGMSYMMDFEDEAKINADDMVVHYDNGNLGLVIDPKSLLYLFGMKLDYSDALIGGGFQFSNPNAQDSCGCGKSFGV